MVDAQLEMSFVQVPLEKRDFDSLNGFDLVELAERFPGRFRQYCAQSEKENARLRRKFKKVRA